MRSDIYSHSLSLVELENELVQIMNNVCALHMLYNMYIIACSNIAIRKFTDSVSLNRSVMLYMTLNTLSRLYLQNYLRSEMV